MVMLTHVKLRSFKSTRSLTTSVLTTITSEPPDASIVVDENYDISAEPLTTVNTSNVEIGLVESVNLCTLCLKGGIRLSLAY